MKKKYWIQLYGKGNELAIGTIPKATWCYIREKFDESADNYIEALDDGDVPEEHRLAENSYSFNECDDLAHHDGCWSTGFSLEVYSDMETTEPVFRCTSDDYAEHCAEMGIECNPVDDKVQFISIWSSVAKGLYLDGYFEIEGEFDPKKLQIVCDRVLWDHGECCDTVVTRIEYDGETLDLGFSGSDGKGDTTEFVEVLQYGDDIEN